MSEDQGIDTLRLRTEALNRVAKENEDLRAEVEQLRTSNGLLRVDGVALSAWQREMCDLFGYDSDEPGAADEVLTCLPAWKGAAAHSARAEHAEEALRRVEALAEEWEPEARLCDGMTPSVFAAELRAALAGSERASASVGQPEGLAPGTASEPCACPDCEDGADDREAQRGNDGLTDRERAELAREWNALAGSYMSAAQARAIDAVEAEKGETHIPGLRPDPELIGNAEGDKKAIERTKRLAREALGDAVTPDNRPGLAEIEEQARGRGTEGVPGPWEEFDAVVAAVKAVLDLVDEWDALPCVCGYRIPNENDDSSQCRSCGAVYLREAVSAHIRIDQEEGK